MLFTVNKLHKLLTNLQTKCEATFQFICDKPALSLNSSNSC